MDIKPSEIDTIKTIGTLNGEDVKLIRLKGGLIIATGKSTKGNDIKPLAAGSHPGIVLHQMEKEYKSEFKSSMAKSEIEDIGSISSFSHVIPDTYIESGYDIFSLTKSGSVEIIVTKYNAGVASFKYWASSETLLKAECHESNMASNFSEWVAKVIKNGRDN